jgi:hypothetical protein
MPHKSDEGAEGVSTNPTVAPARPNLIRADGMSPAPRRDRRRHWSPVEGLPAIPAGPRPRRSRRRHTRSDARPSAHDTHACHRGRFDGFHALPCVWHTRAAKGVCRAPFFKPPLNSRTELPPFRLTCGTAAPTPTFVAAPCNHYHRSSSGILSLTGDELPMRPVLRSSPHWLSLSHRAV